MFYNYQYRMELLIVALDYDLTNREVEAGRHIGKQSESYYQKLKVNPQLHNEFKTSLGYMRSCLKNNKT